MMGSIAVSKSRRAVRRLTSTPPRVRKTASPSCIGSSPLAGLFSLAGALLALALRVYGRSAQEEAGSQRIVGLQHELVAAGQVGRALDLRHHRRDAGHLGVPDHAADELGADDAA